MVVGPAAAPTARPATETQLTGLFVATETAPQAAWLPDLRGAAQLAVDQNAAAVKHRVMALFIGAIGIFGAPELDECVAARFAGQNITNQKDASDVAKTVKVLKKQKVSRSVGQVLKALNQARV